MDRRMLVNKVRRVITNSKNPANRRPHISSENAKRFIDGKERGEKTLNLGTYTITDDLVFELNEKVPEARFHSSGYNIIMTVNEMYDLSADEMRAIAEVTCDNGFLYDLRDQEATEAYDFFKDKRLGFVFEEDSKEYHYCLDDGKLYIYDELADPCMSTVGVDVESLKLPESETEAPESYGSVAEAMSNKQLSNIFHKTESIVTYSGYKLDIEDVRPIINTYNITSLEDEMLNDRPIVHTYVYVHPEEITPADAPINPSQIHVMNRDVFEENYDGTYENYLRCCMIASIWFSYKSDANPGIVFDIAKWRSGVFQDYRNAGLAPSTYTNAKTIQRIYNDGGYEKLRKIVKDNTGKKLVKDIGKNYLSKAVAILGEAHKDMNKVHDDHDWSTDGLAKLSRRIKMNTKKGAYKINDVTKQVEKTLDLNEPNPDQDFDRDGRVEQDEIQRQVHTADIIPTNDRVNSKIPKPVIPSGPAAGGGGAKPKSEAAQLDENCFYLSNGETVMMIGEAVDPKYNKMLYKNLYNDRMRKNSEILAIYADMKASNPWIKYTYLTPNRYKFNLFIDTYFYNQTFFANNIYQRDQAVFLYAELLKRLVNDNRFTAAGYKKQTIFFNVLNWSNVTDNATTTPMWMYRKDFNPISIIFRLMSVAPNMLKDIFGDRDVVFCGPTNYFKVNFSKEHNYDIKARFLVLIRRLIAIGANGIADPDPTDEPTGDSTRAITLDIVEKLDKNQNIKIDSIKPNGAKYVQADLDKKPTDYAKPLDGGGEAVPTYQEKLRRAKDFVEPKAVTGVPVTDKKEIEKAVAKDEKDTLVDNIIDAASNSTSTDDAIDKLDNERIAKLIASVAASEEDTSINKARISRMNSVRDKFLDKQVKGMSVKDMLNTTSKAVEIKEQIPETALPIDSINDEWNHMTYMNFDKNYNVDTSIVKILNSMADWTYPIVVRDLKVEDNSTSEDYLDLWTVECEDSFGKRFRLKFDVPKFMNQNRYMMLRGNRKTIETQLFLMPILKTDEDAAQIVSNYNKIFVRRYNTAPGKSNVYADFIVKFSKKYTGTKIKFTFGDNSRVCSKYDLPMDYIDLAQVISKIETPSVIYYFNQDEIREKYADEIAKDKSARVPVGIHKADKSIIYLSTSYNFAESVYYEIRDNGDDCRELMESFSKSTKYTYSRASILNSNIPVVLLCGYAEGLTKTFARMKLSTEIKETLDKVRRDDKSFDWIRFEDGYLIYENTPEASLMMNGLKECDTRSYSVTDIDSKAMFVDFLDGFCERIKTDGLDNFYDCMIDPITKETLEYYGLPTDYVGCLVYANALLTDNAYIKHTDTKGRRIRRAELIAGYVYKAITNSYATYSQQVKHSRRSVPMSMKQSAVVDLILLDPTEKDYSTSNMLTDVESVNAITTKGLSGMNSERSYDLDKRTYDESMLNVLGMSTGFAGNVGITRQATLNMGVEGERGYVVGINGDTSKLNDVNTLTATEALTPMGTTHDDPFRTAMTFVQKSKHAMRCVNGDPLLVTNGSDEALPYISSDIFAFKAKGKGKVKELVPDSYMIIEYSDGNPPEYVDLSYTVQKNSDGGFYVPLQLVTDLKVGSSVKKGQIVAYDPLSIGNTLGENDNMAYKVGTLAKVALLNTDEGFEDSAIMSHRLSDAMACSVIKVRDVILPKDTNVYNVLSKGTHIEEGDIMMQYQTPYESEDLQILQRNLAGDEEELSSLGRKPVKAECTGTLVDVRIYRTCELDELSPSLRKLVNAYEKPIKEKKKALEAKGIPTHMLPATYKLPATGKLKHCEDGVYIEFCQEYIDLPAVGDKIVWYSANKGVNKGLFPLGEEPYTAMRPNEVIDGFITNTSVNGRMVTSIISVGSLNKLMVELDRSVKDLLGIPYDDSKA